MTNLPNQNLLRPAPPWVAPSATPAPTGASPAIKPTIEPIIENPPDNASPPPESTVEPTIYQPDDKGKKILKTGSVIISMFLLASLTYFSLSLIDKRTLEKKPKTIKPVLELMSTIEKKLKLGPGEKKEVTRWEKSSQELQNVEIAKEVLDWLDDQRDSRGVYIAGYRCSLNEGCNKQKADNRAGLVAIWGRFKYYQVTKDKNDLSIINKDIDLYSNEAVVEVIQNNFWNCKLMYEMWQSNLFSQEQKKKIEKICHQSSYFPLDLIEIDNQIEQNTIKEVDFKKLINEKPPVKINPQNRSDKGTKLVEHSAYASDFVAKYLWGKDEKDLKRGQLFFDKGAKLLVQESPNSYLEGKCVLGTAALDLYKATRKTDYLDFAVLLFEKEKIEDFYSLSQEKKLFSYFHDSLFEQATCAIFTEELANLSEEERYKELRINLVTDLINKLLNFPEYKDGEKGKAAFYSKTEMPNGKIMIHKPVRENGLSVALLMME